MSASTEQLDRLPDFAGVLAAVEAIAPFLPPTPAWSYPRLDVVAGCEVVVKHENTQPTGAFKVRGGLAFLAAAEAASVATGLVTASTGNHAQSIANAARQHGLPATVVVPESAPAGKIAAVEALGAEVIVYGPTMTEAIERAQAIADETGARMVGPTEPDIIHGHATVHLELLRSHPDLEAIYVPTGSGTSAAGACIVRDQLAPNCRIIGVQSAQAPAAHRAWTTKQPATAPCTTRASGLSTAASFDLTQRILVDRLDDFLLVDDTDIDAARRLFATHAHTLAEGAGAAGLAGLLAHADRPERVGVICSGGNADDAELASLT